MTKPSLILIGAGGHAHSCIDVIEEQDYFKIEGLIGLPHEQNIQHLGYAVIGTDEDLPRLSQTYQYALITTGQVQDGDHRSYLFYKAKQLGFQLPVIVAPTAHISRHTIIGEGTVIMHGAIVNAGVSIGSNCIINSRALLEHDVSVGDHCHISTGAILNGGVVVGCGNFIGSASVIKQGIKIGNNCLVGMGLSVRYDMNNQAKFIGRREHD